MTKKELLANIKKLQAHVLDNFDQAHIFYMVVIKEFPDYIDTLDTIQTDLGSANRQLIDIMYELENKNE